MGKAGGIKLSEVGEDAAQSKRKLDKVGYGVRGGAPQACQLAGVEESKNQGRNKPAAPRCSEITVQSWRLNYSVAQFGAGQCTVWISWRQAG